MRPLNLKVEGFTAFKEESEVNFEGMQLGVFVGPNGAGKSSLLEAMLFALFGVAPRMKGKQARDFIAHGCDQFNVIFQFEADGNVYRVQRRYPKKGTPQVRLDIQNNGFWQALADKVEETNKGILSILKVGYDVFTKAVVLPQNLFDQFLKGDKEKRREVLGEILNLELFEKVATLASEKGRLLRELIRQRELQMAEFSSTVSDENLEALQKSLSEYNEEMSQKVQQKEMLKRSLLEMHRWVEKERQVGMLRKELAESEQLSMQVSNDFLRAEKLWVECQENFEKESPKLKNRIDFLQTFRGSAEQYSKLQLEEREKRSEYSKLEEKLKQFEDVTLNLSKELVSVKEKMSSLNSEMKKLEESEERYLLFDNNIEKLNQLKTLLDEVEKLRKKLTLLKKEDQQISSLLLKSQHEKEKIVLELLQAEKEHQAKRNIGFVAELRAELCEGEDCPVCEQPVQKIPAFLGEPKPDVDLSPLRSKHEAIIRENAKQEEAISRVNSEIQSITLQSETANQQTSLLQNELSTTFQIPKEQLLESARNEYKQLKAMRAQLRELRETNQSLEKKTVTLQQSLDAKQQTVKQDLNEKLSLEVILKRISVEMEEIEKKLISAQLPLSALSTLEVENRTLEEKLKQLFIAKDERMQAYHQLKERAEQAKTRHEALEVRTKQEEEEVNQFTQTLVDSRGERISDFKKSQEALLQYQQDLESVEQRLEFLQPEIGKLAKELEMLQASKSKMNEWIAECGAKRKEEGLYLTLQQDLQKNKLPDYLLSTVLSALLEIASEKLLEFSSNRYRFSLEGAGDIQVLDSWNAQEPRSVSSLSGGESFAASLSFALALSEYLQGKQALKCLFIDEGFGNLDRETRDKVAEILASLQSQDRMIGIVTHIDELAELFPHRVVLQKLPEGSKIVQANLAIEERISEAIA